MRKVDAWEINELQKEYGNVVDTVAEEEKEDDDDDGEGAKILVPC